jgi:hypothetical protein
MVVTVIYSRPARLVARPVLQEMLRNGVVSVATPDSNFFPCASAQAGGHANRLRVLGD